MTITPRQVLAILAARWKWALLIVLISVAATATVSVTMLKRYTAFASVMLDARSADQVAGGAHNSLPGGYLATQFDLLNSERVSRAVIQAQNLHLDPRWHEAWLETGEQRGDLEAWLAAILQQGLVVKPAGSGNVINLAYTSRDREEATRLANAYVQAYIDTSLEIRMERVRQYGSFFDARAKALREELQMAQAKLSTFQQRHGLMAGDDLEVLRMTELVTQAVQLQGASAEAAARASLATRQAEQSTDVRRDPAVQALSAEIAREQVRLREMTERIGDKHPQLIEQQTRVAALKAQLAAESGRSASHVYIDRSAGQARLGQVNAMIEGQRARLLRTQGQREEAMALKRDLEQAQRAYQAVQERVSQSTFESQNTFTNVVVLKRATLPTSPSSPNLRKNLLIGFALGGLLAIAFAMGSEFLDRRLRTIDDVTELKQSLLVSLPVSSHGKFQISDTSRTRLIKQRVMTGLPRPRPN